MSTNELSSAISKNRRLVEKQRVRVRKSVRGRPRGRPIRHSGIYYTKHVLITDRFWQKLQKIRMPNEPIGSALERYVGLAEQKKVNAPLDIGNQSQEAFNIFERPEHISDDFIQKCVQDIKGRKK